jgi:hypothetical protein
MKRTITLCLIVLVLSALTTPAWAAKPTGDKGVPFGNGYPSGEHFNLNIIAKKDNFTCPEPKYDEFGDQEYGNVIFIPRIQGNDDITILMESGKKGPKNAPGISVLQVRDWCSESFPDEGTGKGDEAVIYLPANANGFAVYARIAGKPGKAGEPSITIDPNLVYVEDEAGNDLIFLGLVDREGVSTFALEGQTLVRTTALTSAKGKGAQKATDITGLFQWSGEVCYVQDDSDIYCIEDGEDVCWPTDLCCTDVDGDGVYENCEYIEDVGVYVDDILVCPNTDPNIPVIAQCKIYDNEWVFNIGDFVGYLWDIDTTGAYVIKVRFYPL